jgi:hypothetical protein
VQLCGLLISARAVCRRTVLFELVHNDVEAGGEVNTGALGLSVDCVCVGTLKLCGVTGVWVPLGMARDILAVGT